MTDLINKKQKEQSGRMASKKLKAFLSTSALVAAGMVVFSAPAWAGDGPVGDYDVMILQNTNPSEQSLGYVSYKSGDRIIDNAIQEDTGRLAETHFDTPMAIITGLEKGPMQILGKVTATGDLYLVDTNGFIFGNGSVVDARGFAASTGSIVVGDDDRLTMEAPTAGAGILAQGLIKAQDFVVLHADTIKNVGDIVVGAHGRFIATSAEKAQIALRDLETSMNFEGFDDGVIVNTGTISVGDAGLAAFVAPTVTNSGIINAKLGHVAFAAGDKVTLDLYGDGLVEVAVDGELSDALLENSGAINAEGGTVTMTVSAVKEVVDNVINMDGVISVSSVEVKGGKIILGGGDSGTVTVSGTLDASGTDGGEIEVTGEQVYVADTAVLDVSAGEDGDGGTAYIYGNKYTVFEGYLAGRGGTRAGKGGFAELSAGDSVGFNGMVDLGASNGAAGTFLIDPAHLYISNTYSGPLTIYAQALANVLANNDVNLWATETLSTGSDINISEYDYDVLNTHGTWKPWLWTLDHYNGITDHNLTVAAPEVNLVHDITLGTGALNVFNMDSGTSVVGLGLATPPYDILVDHLNLDGRIYKRAALADSSFTTLADDAQINTTADTINVLSDDALIQQAVYFAEAGATINVAAGEYHESVSIENRDGLTVNGANAGIAGDDAARGAESVIMPNSPGFYVTSDNVTIDGFEIDGQGTSEVGIYAAGANNLMIKNNVIHDQWHSTGTGNSTGIPGYGDGIYMIGGSGSTIQNNAIYNTNDDGIQVEYLSDLQIIGNVIDNTDGDVGIAVTNNYNAGSIVIAENEVSNALRHGIMVYNTSGDTVIIRDNEVNNSAQSSIHVENIAADTVSVRDNVIVNAAAGIKILNTDGARVIDNEIDGDEDGKVGIHVEDSDNALLKGNVIYSQWDASGQGGQYGLPALGDGIYITGSTGSTIKKNTIYETNDDGIQAEDVSDLRIIGNIIDNKDGDVGIAVLRGSDAGSILIAGNEVENARRHGIMVYDLSGDSVTIRGNTVDNSHNSGIHVEDVRAETTIVAHNDIKKSGENGIYVDGVNNIGIFANTIHNSGINGIYVTDFGAGAWIRGNEIHNSIANGIFVEGDMESVVRIVKNEVHNSGENGIKVADVANVYILDNKAHSSIENGIEVVDSAYANIAYNNLSDIGDYASSVIVPLALYEEGPEEDESGADAIYVENVYGYNNGADEYVYGPRTNVSITGNIINRTADDGIEVIGSGATLINGNVIKNAGIFGGGDYYGADAIHVRDVWANTEYDDVKVSKVAIVEDIEDEDHGEGHNGPGRSVTITGNFINKTADDGIEVLYSGPTRINENTIWNVGSLGYAEPAESGLMTMAVSEKGYYPENDGYGADAIHVREVSGYGNEGDSREKSSVSVESEGGSAHERGFPVEITGNFINKTADDGIEVVDSGRTLIAENNIFGAGYYEGGDIYGADGIHVRGVIVHGGNHGQGEEERSGPFGNLYQGSHVEIRNNNVAKTGDDGIQVLWSGNTLIDGNNVFNAGLYGGTRLFGGDGIQVVTGLEGFGLYRQESKGRYGATLMPVRVEVTGNTVVNAVDDGVQVVGANDVLVEGNTVNGSGDDGINILGFAGYANSDEIDEEPVLKVALSSKKPVLEWPEFNAVVVNNTVAGSAGDGAQIEGFDNILFAGNTVSNSGANGLYVSGPNNGYVTVSGNGFTDNDIGAQFESGTIDLTGEGNTFEGGRVGLRFAPYAFGESEEEYYNELAYATPSERDIYGMLYPYPFTTPFSGYAPLALVDDDGVDGFGGTIGAQSFDGQSEYFVELDNEAFFAPGEPTILNGLDSTYVTPFGTITPATTGGVLTQAQYNYLEEMFFHYVDRDDIGLFFFGYVPENPLDIGVDIDLEDIFNSFNPFTVAGSGLNITIAGPLTIPGGTAFSLANLAPFAGGGEDMTPEQLAGLTPAAGGDETDPNAVAQFLANVEPAAGGDDLACWGDAVAGASAGTVTNYSFGSSASEMLADASRCQSSF